LLPDHQNTINTPTTDIGQSSSFISLFKGFEDEIQISKAQEASSEKTIEPLIRM
jgi:hypothetical protein